MAKKQKNKVGSNSSLIDPAGSESLQQRIAEKAYALFLERGAAHGDDVTDWLQAERIIQEELAAGKAKKVTGIPAVTEPSSHMLIPFPASKK